MTCSSEVAGYSIEHNSWGFFHIHYTSDAKFNAEAFGSLVYPEDHKHMMLTLVQSHQVLVVNYYNGHEYTEKQYEEGHVFLLYGPSGTGKTLAIRKLWTFLSVHQLFSFLSTNGVFIRESSRRSKHASDQNRT